MKLISTIAVMIFLTGMASAAPNLEATGAVAKTPHSLFMLRVAEGEPLDGMMHAPLVRVRSISDGMFDGMMAAERIGTGGNVVGGLLVGVFTGLIGTGIGYLIIGPANIDVNALVMMEGVGKGGEYQNGFMVGWDKKTRSRKKNAFLAGGLLGTLAIVTLMLSGP